jgi:hypothetical protein
LVFVSTFHRHISNTQYYCRYPNSADYLKAVTQIHPNSGLWKRWFCFGFVFPRWFSTNLFIIIFVLLTFHALIYNTINLQSELLPWTSFVRGFALLFSFSTAAHPLLSMVVYFLCSLTLRGICFKEHTIRGFAKWCSPQSTRMAKFSKCNCLSTGK